MSKARPKLATTKAPESLDRGPLRDTPGLALETIMGAIKASES